MRPRLCEVFAISGQELAVVEYEWMFYAGMGSVDFRPASEDETAAVKDLLPTGAVVPMFEEDADFGIKSFRRIKHIDDVSFGLTAQDEMILFEMTSPEDFPDFVIKPDGRYDKAIAQIKHRLAYNRAVVDAAIQLKEGPIVRPIILDQNMIELRKRQRHFDMA